MQIIDRRIQRLNIILESGDAFVQQSNKEIEYDESARLDNLNQQPVNANLYILAEQELSRLKANIKWLDSKDAGKCKECGIDIPVRRLIAVPTTRHCVDCADSP